METRDYIPDGFHTVTPYLIVHGAADLIDFMEAAFGAKVLYRMAGDDGSIQHAQVRIGDSMIEVGGARPEWPETPCSLHLYVADADAAYERALRAGATSLYEPDDKFYGDREAGVKDAAGNRWFLATRKEILSEEEVAERAAAR